MDAKVDALELRLRQKLDSLTGFGDEMAKARKLQTFFTAVDRSGNGQIEYEEFAAMLASKLNFVGVSREIEALFGRYDTDASGTIDFREFSACVSGLKPPVAPDMRTRSVIEHVVAALKRRGGNGIHGLTRLLRSIDSNGSGTLDREELSAGLSDLGLGVSADEMILLFDHLDRDKSGTINAEELLRAVKGSQVSYERKVLIRQAFQTLDRAGRGAVAVSDLLSVYDASHHPSVLRGDMTPEDAVREFLHQLEGGAGNRDGVVTWAEFLDYYTGLSILIDRDDYFELMVRNAFHLSGGEGAAANSSNLRVLVTHSDGREEVVALEEDLGVRPTDFAEIRRRLARQGITDIKKVAV